MYKDVGHKIFHYTSIESLALILKTRKIRFTRLDRVDDVIEAQEHCGINFGKYFFVSCWTEQKTESIPQWNMYSKDMQGVRIELPVYPFYRHRLKANPAVTGVTWEGEMMSLLTFDELLGETYFVPPLFSDNFFCGKVDYIESVNDFYNTAVQKTEHPNGKIGILINELPKLPRQKSKEWHFQSEYRFHLFALPISSGHTKASPYPPGIGLGEIMGDALINNIDPGINYIDVPIDSAAFSQMVVRTAPLCTSGGRICVEALISQLAPEALIEPSALAGTIRTRTW